MEKTVWIIALIFGNFVAAFLYYFLVYKKDKKSDPRWLYKLLIIAFGIMFFSTILVLFIFLVNHFLIR